jgi:Ca2+-binding RTX toxin-like protein
VKSTGQTYTTKTAAAGGYDLALSPGTYKVTLSGGGSAVTKQVSVGTANVKSDWIDPGSAAGTAGVAAAGGTDGPNTLRGTAASDTINGLGGDDRISGGAANDHLYGGRGRDALQGDAGDDVLIGGSDADTFQFRGAWGHDRVADYQHGTDHLDLRTTGLSFADLSIAARDVDRDGVADDTLITAGGQSIALLNVKAALIGAADFHL